MEKITIHRALSELKIIKDRIDTAIKGLAVVGVYQQGKLVNQAVVKEEYEVWVKARYQSITDLMIRKSSLKQAIVASNAVTKVTIAGKEMTVADAISFKSDLEQHLVLRNHLRGELTKGQAQHNMLNGQVADKLQRLLEAAFGKDNVKTSKDDVDAISKPFLEANQWYLCDPLSAEKLINQMDDELGKFQAEADACLSESNAVTFIEI